MSMEAAAASIMAAKKLGGAKKLAGAKKYNQSVMNAVKASPAGMFPAAAAKAGITMGSKLGQAITKSGTGKIPSQMQALGKKAMAKDAAWEKKNPGAGLASGKPRVSNLAKLAKKYTPNAKRYLGY